MEDNGQLAFAVTLSDDSIRKTAEAIKRQFEGISTKAAEEGGKIDAAFKKIGGYAGAYFSVSAAASFAKQIVRVRGEIESLEVSFKTLLGDEKKATELMSEIRKFAANTPMQMNDLAAGAQTLLGFNVEAEKVMPTLKALGDISMGNSQKFQSLTLAFAQMSSTGKLMGQDLLQMINAGFNPLMQISEKTGKSIATLKDEMSKGQISAEMVTQAFMDATAEGGKFHAMLEQQSKGIQGSLSNVQGALQDMMNELGEKMQQPITDSLKLVQKLIQSYEKVGKVIASLVSTYGAYKAAVMAYNAAMAISTSVTKGYTVAQQLEYTWLLLVEKAQKLLNRTMLKNPFVIVTTAVLGLVSALVLLRKRANEAELAQNALNNAAEESGTRQENLKNKTEQLLQTLDDENATETEHNKALKELKGLYGELLKDVSNYNDYLENRKHILDSMPKERERIETGEQQSRLATLREEYALVKKVSDARNAGKITQEETKAYLELLRKYNKQAKEDGYPNVEAYLKGQLDAQEKQLKERLENIREAEWANKPIEQRIEITQTSIQQAEASAAYLRRQLEAQPMNVMLKLNLEQAEADLSRLREQLANLESQKTGSTKTDFGAEVRKAEAELKRARQAYRKVGSEVNKQAVETASTVLDAAKKNYKLATGKDYDQVAREAKERAKTQREANKRLRKEEEETAQWLIRQARQHGLDEEQARIDGLKDGFAKEQAQIALNNRQRLAEYDDYKEELLERLRDLAEAQWNVQNADKVKNGEEFNRYAIGVGVFDNPNELQSVMGINQEGIQRLSQYVTDALSLLNDKKKILDKQAENETKALYDRQIDEFLSYTQRRENIRRQYNSKIEALYKAGTVTRDKEGNITGGDLRNGVTQANVDEAYRAKDEALKSLDAEIASRSAAYQNWLGKISSMSVKQLRALLETAQKALKTLENDPDADPNKLAEARAKVSELSDAIAKAELSPDEEKIEQWLTWSDAISAAGQSFSSLGEDIDGTFGKILTLIGEAFNATSTVIDNITSLARTSMEGIEDTAETTSRGIAAAQSAVAILAIIQAIYTIVCKLRDALDDTLNFDGNDSGFMTFLSDFLHYLTDTETMVENLAWSLLGPLGTALGVLTSKNKNSDRQKINKQIEQLGNSYEELGVAISDVERKQSKAFGESKSRLIKEQIDLINAQKESLREQMSLERDKGKKADQDKIDDWQKQYDQLNRDIDDLRDSMADAIFGESIQSAVENLADAIVSVWEEGADAAEAAGKVAEKVLQSMMVEQLKDSIMQRDTERDDTAERINEYRTKAEFFRRVFGKAGEDIAKQYEEAADRMGETLDNKLSIGYVRDKIKEFMADGELSDEERDEIKRLYEQLMGEIKDENSWMQDIFEDSSAASRNANQTGIAQASQDSIDELNGRMTAVQGHTSIISENSSIIRDTVTAIHRSVISIEGYTAHLVNMDSRINDMASRLDNIDRNGVLLRSE